VRHGGSLFPLGRQSADPEATDHLNYYQAEMSGHEQPSDNRNGWRHAQDSSGDHLDEADVTFGKSVMQQVPCLREKQQSIGRGG